MSGFLKVVDELDSSEVIELPYEDDNSLLLSTLTAQFPDAIGLKYKVPETGSMRGVRLSEGKLLPPANTSWDDYVFICTFPKATKRKAEDIEESALQPASQKMELDPDHMSHADLLEWKKKRTSDLIVLDIPYTSEEKDLKEYFTQFGDVVLCQVKKDASGKSKGFGFIRFEEYDSQVKAMSKKHLIGGRWCEVRIPNNKFQGDDVSNRLFVGRVPEWMTEDDMQKYFVKFGEIANVFLPRNPFRGFAFLTFVDPFVAMSLRKQDHTINGHSVYLHSATPKGDKKAGNNQQGGQGFNQNNKQGGQMGGGYQQQGSMGGDTAAQIAAAVATALAQAGVGGGGQGFGGNQGYRNSSGFQGSQSSSSDQGYRGSFQPSQNTGSENRGGYSWGNWK